MKTKTEIHYIMKSHNFRLHRVSKHLIWRDDKGNQIVTGSSISDHRAVSNIKKQLQRLTVTIH
jgi:hypothetical protein